jgi:hypothetical protein
VVYLGGFVERLHPVSATALAAIMQAVVASMI